MRCTDESSKAETRFSRARRLYPVALQSYFPLCRFRSACYRRPTRAPRKAKLRQVPAIFVSTAAFASCRRNVENRRVSERGKLIDSVNEYRSCRIQTSITQLDFVPKRVRLFLNILFNPSAAGRSFYTAVRSASWKSRNVEQVRNTRLGDYSYRSQRKG